MIEKPGQRKKFLNQTRYRLRTVVRKHLIFLFSVLFLIDKLDEMLTGTIRISRKTRDRIRRHSLTKRIEKRSDL